jgi:predicted Rossmann fold flavoprotein
MGIFYALLVEGDDNFSQIAIILWQIELSFTICLKSNTFSGLSTMGELGDFYMAKNIDVVVIGAGAAGLMCAIEAGRRGRSVLVLDHAAKFAEKIRISGGGRCNFTNLYTAPENFLSANPHFCKSALDQYSQFDFIDLVDKHKIAHHEKKYGQLFCDHSAQNIIDMLKAECNKLGVVICMENQIRMISSRAPGFSITTNDTLCYSQSLVIASGGLSIPKIGASGFGYDVARKFGVNILRPRPGLVPLVFDEKSLHRWKTLSGLSLDASVAYNRATFSDGMLFTHRGISGPSILQISSYWQTGTQILINLAPNNDATQHLLDAKGNKPKTDIVKCLAELIPKRLATELALLADATGRLGDINNKKIRDLGILVNDWQIEPVGTEGYRTAEVTLGGVDTNDLSSQTMQAREVPGLFFIGEVVDVTGHLGGYNFQWAWSSGFVAGQHA